MMATAKDLDTAYLEGYIAQTGGRSRDECPYRAFTSRLDMRACWLEGWDAASEEVKREIEQESPDER